MAGRGAGRSRTRKAVRALGWLAGILMLLLAAAAYLLYAPRPPEPELGARPRTEAIRVGALERSYMLYAPAGAAAGAPLLVVFHGSMGSPSKIRAETGYEFDRLADRHGFVVAYPQGHGGHWNDCRRVADYDARRLDIDDLAFFEALVARLRRDRGIDRSRVFVAGVSNGGHFVFRLALERPELVAGAAAFAASLPTPDNSVCRAASAPPPPMLLVNGTSDPLNPYEGGIVSLFGFGNRGTVRSAVDSARYFASRRGAAGPAIRTIRPRRPDGTFVERSAWRGAAGDEVVLMAVKGGGHVVPQAAYRPPRLLGRVTSAIDGPAEAWEFFRRLPSRPGR